MIRVELADEPLDFDAKVRQPGLRAIAELAGEPGLPKRKGRPRKAIANSREQIPADKFPSYWTEALPELSGKTQRPAHRIAFALNTELHGC